MIACKSSFFYAAPKVAPGGDLRQGSARKYSRGGRKIFRQMHFSLVAPEGVINFAAKKEGRVIVHAPKPI